MPHFLLLLAAAQQDAQADQPPQPLQADHADWWAMLPGMVVLGLGWLRDQWSLHCHDEM